MTYLRGPLLVAAALLGLVLAAYPRVLLLGDTFAARDHLVFTVPAHHYLATALAAGRFPQWCEALGLGVPFAANPNNFALYPPAWLFALIRSGFGADLFLLFHLLAAGLGTAAFARRLGADPAGGTLAAAALMTSGYTASMAVYPMPLPTLGWTPWIAWAADRVARADSGKHARLRDGAVLAALLGGQILSGDPAGLITSWLLALAVVVSRAERRLPSLGLLAAAFGGSLLLSAAQLLPVWSVLQQSERAAGVGLTEAGAWSMHPFRLVELFWPRFLGDPTIDSLDLARVAADSSGGVLVNPQWSLSVYLGLPVLLAAALGAKQRGARGLAIASLVFLIIALGTYTPAYSLFRLLVPPARFIRYPEKQLAGALLLWCALAGVGFTRLLRERLSRRAVWTALVAAGTLGALVLAAWLFEEELASALAARARAAHLFADVHRAIGIALGDGATAFAVAAAAGVLVFLLRFPRLRNLSAAALATLAVAHSLAHGWAVVPLVKRESVETTPALLEPALADASPGEGLRSRLYPRDVELPASASSAEGAAAVHESVGWNTAVRYGLSAVPGLEPAHSARFWSLWNEAVDGVALGLFLDLFDVKYAVIPTGAAAAPGLAERARGRLGNSLVENTGRRPRAFVAPRWSWAGTDQESQAALLATGPRDVARVILTGTGAPPPPAREGEAIAPCAISAPRPEQLELACDSVPGGYAVVLEEWAPGWSATVDGVPAQIERADVLAMAVPVAPGSHRVSFSYRTPGLRAGLGVSAAAWLGWGASLWLARSRRRPDRGPPAVSSPHGGTPGPAPVDARAVPQGVKPAARNNSCTRARRRRAASISVASSVGSATNPSE
ncbi:MAG: YfhO family protein [Myxococcales bacterium]|nr:YfhO family protein [Myxococcales bacterium]